MVHGTGHPPAWLRSYPDSTLQAPQVSKHRQMPKPHTSGSQVPPYCSVLSCMSL